MTEPDDSDMAPAVPVSELLLKYCAAKSVRKYRLLHRRQDGKNFPLLLQNRVFEAESAEEALQAALACLGDSAPFVRVKDNSAWVVQASGRFIDIWECGLD